MSGPQLVIVSPADEADGWFSVNYYNGAIPESWIKEMDVEGRPRWRRRAELQGQSVAVGYTPFLTGPGRYRIEVFIPAGRSGAHDVQYHVAENRGGVQREIVCFLDQSKYADQWAPLSGDDPAGGPRVTEFELDPAVAGSGRVNVIDMTFQDRPEGFEVHFGAIRWVPFVVAPPAEPRPEPQPKPRVEPAPVDSGSTGVEVIGSNDGKFHSPVGSPDARLSPLFGVAGDTFRRRQVWVPEWYDANPIGSRYQLERGKWAIHTGADLNRTGGDLADRLAPVHACADGEVIFSAEAGTWKGLVVIKHAVPGEVPVFIRYAHLEQLRFNPGDFIRRGEVLGLITLWWKGAGSQNWHLHFDMSRRADFETHLRLWPGEDRGAVRAWFIDPLEFIRAHH